MSFVMKQILVFILISGVIISVPAQQDNFEYCTTVDDEDGECVALSRCPELSMTMKKMNPRMAQRMLQKSKRACDNYDMDNDPEICCKNPLEFPTTTKPTAIEDRAGFNVCRGPDQRQGSCVELRDCKSLLDELQLKHGDPAFANYLRASNKICGGQNTMVCCPSGVLTTSNRDTNSDAIPRSLPTVEDGCGRNSITPTKIVGGQESKVGAWPWMALLGYEPSSSSPFKCGGSLVTARHVITAAHCINNALKFVRLGEHDLTTDTEAQHVDINIQRAVKHPNYVKRSGHSDIAILYLERNVAFTKSILPICLPTTPALRQKDYVRYNPFVAGWGKNHENGTARNVLYELQIMVYTNDLCRQEYQKRNILFSQNQFDSAVLCAGVLTGGKDSCQGDSGGPLMIPEIYKNVAHFHLLGVIAYGNGCGRPEIPAVYTSVQYFMDWIIERIQDTQ
ncbi:venom protease [Musca domestica]|uniref:CLIP domain-containing serine protease n=1 Tax=Musca domestica TaxID=7370 RepID=A0A9J7CZV2_MUSDO|nr:venom protease [Musca domestica]